MQVATHCAGMSIITFTDRTCAGMSIITFTDCTCTFQSLRNMSILKSGMPYIAYLDTIHVSQKLGSQLTWKPSKPCLYVP